MFSRWNWVCPSDTFQTQYKESWKKIRDGGYKLRLDAIPFQSAKASAEILSDVRIHFIIWNHIITIFLAESWTETALVNTDFQIALLTKLCVFCVSFQQKYREEFQKTKGKMIGLKGLQDDLNIAHSVYASKLQSDVST